MYMTPAIHSALTLLGNMPEKRTIRHTPGGFRLHGPLLLKAVRDVPTKAVDDMIEHGYIARQDQRAIFYITERGKIAVEESTDVE